MSIKSIDDEVVREGDKEVRDIGISHPLAKTRSTLQPYIKGS